jgi:hypothetical protein
LVTGSDNSNFFSYGIQAENIIYSKGTLFKSPKLRKQPAGHKTLERAVEEETKGRLLANEMEKKAGRERK